LYSKTENKKTQKILWLCHCVFIPSSEAEACEGCLSVLGNSMMIMISPKRHQDDDHVVVALSKICELRSEVQSDTFGLNQ
jgi:hypothetical protein